MSTIKTDTLQNVAGTKSVPVNTVVDGSAKAWVNFNGTGTVAIRAAFNVTSITDNGTGNYTVNFTSAFADTNYTCVSGLARNATNDFVHFGAATTTTQGIEFWSGGAQTDSSKLMVSFFR